MSWFKLLGHDLRCGLLRSRYLAASLLALIPCVELLYRLRVAGMAGSWMDYMLNLFKGSRPYEMQIPFGWLLIVGACLYINLDYMLYDLTNNGQQIIVRSRSRRGWFLAKCLWNLAGTAAYFLLTALVVLLFVTICGEAVYAENTPVLSLSLFAGAAAGPVVLTAWQGLLIGVLLPYLTVAALSLLEMTLCLVLKPILSFLICAAVLILPVCWDSPLALGIGAMTVRSSLIGAGGHEPMAVLWLPVAVIAACVVAGTAVFEKTDILGTKE